MGQTSDRFRLILCFGGLLLATVLAAWSASEALSAVGRLLGPLPAIPVLAYAVVGWIGYLLTFKFDTEFVKSLRGIVACWAIGLSLAAMVELFVRIWAIPSGSLRSFERIWLDERDRLNWILRYNLLALALSTIWVLTVRYEWSRQFMPRSLTAVHHVSQVLTVLTVALSFSFFTGRSGEAIAADALSWRQSEAMMVQREQDDAVAEMQARRPVDAQIKQHPMWLQEQFEFVVRRYGPDGCRRNDATCREVFEHFKFADAQDLSAEQIANVRSVVKSIHPGKRLSTEIAHNPDLPQELRRMPNDSVEWQAQVNVVHRLVEQRDKATKENRASKDNLQHAVIETIGAPVFEGLQSVGMDKLLGSFAEAISQQWIAKVWEAHGAPVPIPEGYEVLVGARQRVMKPSDLGRKEVDLGRTVENQGSIRWASIGESVSSFVKRWRRVLKTDYKRRYNGPWRPPFR